MNLLSGMISKCFINIISRIILIVIYQIEKPGQPWIIFGICGVIIRILSTCIVPFVDIINGRTLDISWYKKVNNIGHIINLVIEPMFVYMYMQIPCLVQQCGNDVSTFMIIYALMMAVSVMMDILYGNMINRKFDE
jgi:hypothetical protein